MTTQKDINEWKDRAPKGSTHLIVVCDSFSYEDYPVFVSANEDVNTIKSKYNGVNMQRIMEVIKL